MVPVVCDDHGTSAGAATKPLQLRFFICADAASSGWHDGQRGWRLGGTPVRAMSRRHSRDDTGCRRGRRPSGRVPPCRLERVLRFPLALTGAIKAETISGTLTVQCRAYRPMTNQMLAVG